MKMANKAPAVGAAQIKLLEKLCRAAGVSGGESEVRKIILDEIKPHVDEVKVDALGDVLAFKKGGGAKRLRLMLDAHMDEVGFILVAEDGEGLYRFKTIGGIDPRNLAGKQVLLGRERKPGVIGLGPIHLTTADERKRLLSEDVLRIDIGPEAKVKIGERGTFAPNFQRVGPALMSKSLDNRLGVATLIELLKGSYPNIDLCAAFTVQEEVGLRGVKVAADYFKPEVGIVIDSTPANDLPMQFEGENTFYNTKLGLGPAIYVSNSSTLDDPRLVRFLQKVAEQAGITYQIRQPGGGGTNAGGIQRAGAGVPVVSVSVPHRYTHSPMSVARLDDWKNTLVLLYTAIRQITPALLKR
jgi:tetrahedral aminopeptidase